LNKRYVRLSSEAELVLEGTRAPASHYLQYSYETLIFITVIPYYPKQYSSAANAFPESFEVLFPEFCGARGSIDLHIKNVMGVKVVETRGPDPADCC
jgi:hypothetical protein